MGYHAVSKQRAVPDILVRDLGVTQVELHDALLPHALRVQLEARSLLETWRNLSDQLPLRVRQPHHLRRERDRGPAMAKMVHKAGNTRQLSRQPVYTKPEAKSHERLPRLSYKLSRRHLTASHIFNQMHFRIILEPKGL